MKLEGMNLGRAIVQLGIDKQSQVTISSTPFGTGRGEPNQAVLKGAVPWKGVRGMDALEKIAPDVAAGLKKARKMAKAKEGVEGATYHNGVYMPKAAAELAEEAK